MRCHTAGTSPRRRLGSSPGHPQTSLPASESIAALAVALSATHPPMAAQGVPFLVSTCLELRRPTWFRHSNNFAQVRITCPRTIVTATTHRALKNGSAATERPSKMKKVGKFSNFFFYRLPCRSRRGGDDCSAHVAARAFASRAVARSRRRAARDCIFARIFPNVLQCFARRVFARALQLFFFAAPRAMLRGALQPRAPCVTRRGITKKNIENFCQKVLTKKLGSSRFTCNWSRQCCERK